MSISSNSLFAVGLSLALLAGCNSVTKHDNPVFGPLPQRTSLEDAANAKAIAEASDLETPAPVEGEVQQASFTTADDTDIFNATVVARANGAPIFASEVLERYGEYLRQVRPRVTDAEYQKLREEIIRRDLKGHIQKHLLVERTKGELKPEQLKGLNTQLEKLFEKEVERLKKELKVATRTELERELMERGTSLNDIRNSFVTQGIARGYIDARAEKPKAINRKDLVNYYREHEDDYRIPAKVRWQQIQITHQTNGGKAKAEEKMRLAKAELERGVSFATVAAKYSDGPTAQEEGIRDWITENSLADDKLDNLLFEAPVQKLAEYNSKQACQIVQVLERTETSVKRFEDVQSEIFGKLQPDAPVNIKEMIDKIYAEAVIETKYDFAGDERGM